MRPFRQNESVVRATSSGGTIKQNLGRPYARITAGAESASRWARPREVFGVELSPPTVLYCHSWNLHKTDEKKIKGIPYIATSLWS